MTRLLYRWLVALHPQQFRGRFGDEMLCIFEEAEGERKSILFADVILSVLRQRLVRSESLRLAWVFMAALAQMTIGAVAWMGVIGQIRVIGPFPLNRTLGELETSRDAGLLLLLLVGIVTAILVAVTIIGVSMNDVCRRRGRRTTPSHASRRVFILTLAITIAAGATSMDAQHPMAQPSFEVNAMELSHTGHW